MPLPALVSTQTCYAVLHCFPVQAFLWLVFSVLVVWASFVPIIALSKPPLWLDLPCVFGRGSWLIKPLLLAGKVGAAEGARRGYCSDTAAGDKRVGRSQQVSGC